MNNYLNTFIRGNQTCQYDGHDKVQEANLLKYYREEKWASNLMRPGIIDKFDDNLGIMYNDEDHVYHLHPSADLSTDPFSPGFKRPDFIFKTGDSEVTVETVLFQLL